MKIALWALIVVGIYFLYQLTIGKVFHQYTNCYDIAKGNLHPEDEAESAVCVSEKLVYDDLVSCIKKVEKQNNFAAFLYQASPSKRSIEADITDHNQACPNQIVSLPKESFYISAGTNR